MVAELNPCFYILRVREMFSFSPLSFPPLQQPQNSQLPEPSKQQWRWTWRFPAKWQERPSVNERDHFVSKRRKLQRWTTVCTASPVAPFTENITCKTSGLCCSMLGWNNPGLVQYESLKSKCSLIHFVYNFMTGSSTKNGQNYLRKCFWTKEKQTQININLTDGAFQ